MGSDTPYDAKQTWTSSSLPILGVSASVDRGALCSACSLSLDDAESG